MEKESVVYGCRLVARKRKLIYIQEVYEKLIDINLIKSDGCALRPGLFLDAASPRTAVLP